MTVTTPVQPLKLPTELAPDFRLAIALIFLGLPLALAGTISQLKGHWIFLGLGGTIGLLGLFLLLQTLTIRLRFTQTALEVTRSGNLIRRFPYQDWQNWEIFWGRVPILFYFKEVKSIHFLPMLFDPKALRSCLKQCYPKT